MAQFKTRARTVDMLGRQQIAGVPNAISELFKNAHDAYADHVEVDYFLSDGLFVLRDDGIGMTREEFDERWLTLGTESKLGTKGGMAPPPKDPDKPVRPISGEKGIGRLAIAAIGPQVLILTRSGRGTMRGNLVVAYIHWGLFELPGINLDEIEIPVREFPGGALPSRSDLAAMIGQVSSNVEKLATRTDAVIVQRILSEMKQFDFDVHEMNAFLSEVSPDLSLEENGRGTHFYILPAVETLQQDIEIDAKEGKEISKLRRQLFGFTNTMTPDDSPAIQTAFRCWRPDDSPRELLEAKEFWTPEDLDKGDHRFTGSFDEYGQFRGKVCIYDQEPVDFVLPWSGSRGRPTSCGPFKVDIGYLQGLQRESRLPPDEWNALNRKLERIGGVYIYRDGIRILPYGDVDSDWLEIEKRRSLGAQILLLLVSKNHGRDSGIQRGRIKNCRRKPAERDSGKTARFAS